jgi:uncharacterized protein with ParB-like and HNH nuclease domain
MQAKETKLQDIIEGTKQYILPLFQRSYSWDKKEWDVLWEDLCELSEIENPRSHFIGSIVNMPTTSVPEGVSKYMLIDGQQRITTVFIILALLRDLAKQNNEIEFAEEINNTLLVNPYKRGTDYYKLMPTQIDREEFQKLIQNQLDGNESQIKKAYNYFDSKLKRNPIEKDQLKKLITNYLSIVSIVLDNDDNPYLVFESLNAKGRPLIQADLIKNYFFMRIHYDQQNEVYTRYWQPMESRLGDKLTDYIRHYLMMEGAIVKQNDVYHSLKEKVDQNNAIEYLKNLSNTSIYYHKLIVPENETDISIRKYLIRLNRIEVTTAYPLLLNFYKSFASNSIDSAQFTELLKLLENYLIRRFVCGLPTNQLNKIFPTVIIALITNHQQQYIEGMKTILSSKGYPKNSAFRKSILESKLYGSGDRSIKTKLILESLEESYAHREAVPFSNLSIEHIMPQTLSEWWQHYLGEEWEIVYELQLHNIGNLTLTGYNSELSNDDFQSKKKLYADSHLEINKYFANITDWKKLDIEKRARTLSNIMINIWSYFGTDDPEGIEVQDVTGTTPQALTIMGQYFSVNNWRDVLENTLNVLADIDPDTFELLINEYPRFLNKDKSKLRAIRELKNGCFVEVNLSAKSVEKFCRQTIEFFDLSPDDWKIQVA